MSSSMLTLRSAIPSSSHLFLASSGRRVLLGSSSGFRHRSFGNLTVPQNTTVPPNQSRSPQNTVGFTSSSARRMHTSHSLQQSAGAASMSQEALPLSVIVERLIPVIRDLSYLRQWRQNQRDSRRSVGVVPTMGALHDGHLNLVRHSMAANPSTVMTLFVNPTQFAPHEDLSSYPRTMEHDLQRLCELLPSEYKTQALEGRADSEPPIVVFAPQRETMYPLSNLEGPSEDSGEAGGESMLQDTSKQRGAFVEVKGWGDVLEGTSRPQFFRGVATICTKLFNAVQPDHAYFGQKDIQQALLLKIMLKDLLMSYPSSDTLHILPTSRDPTDHLALSSRNAYLTAEERPHASTLYKALSAAKEALLTSTDGRAVTGAEMVDIATQIIQSNPHCKLDYIEVFDKTTFRPLLGSMTTTTTTTTPASSAAENGKSSETGVRESVICGAMWLGKTRLIDNLLIGWDVAEDLP